MMTTLYSLKPRDLMGLCRCVLHVLDVVPPPRVMTPWRGDYGEDAGRYYVNQLVSRKYDFYFYQEKYI